MSNLGKETVPSLDIYVVQDFVDNRGRGIRGRQLVYSENGANPEMHFAGSVQIGVRGPQGQPGQVTIAFPISARTIVDAFGLFDVTATAAVNKAREDVAKPRIIRGRSAPPRV